MKQRGITLIEVMVTLLIIGIGLLGLLGLQAKSLSGHKDSFDRKTAAELIVQISERMRSNHLGFMSDAYASSMGVGVPVSAPPSCGGTTNCTVTESAQLDIASWQANVRSRLADSGTFIVTRPGPGSTMLTNGTSVRVTIAWRDGQPATFADTACADVGITQATYRCIAAEVFP